MNARANISKWTSILLILVIISNGAFADRIIYVDDDAAGANDGSSWIDAYKYLQDALADANESDKPVEIRVAQGVYRPDQGINHTPGNREETFRLINDVNLKGGYAGLGLADPNDRNIKAYDTILSGDLDGNDVDVNDLRNLMDEPTRAENSYHVVICININDKTLFEGFTVTGGNANGDWFTHAVESAGMRNISSNLIITNCIFSENSSRAEAGGMHNTHNSNPKITNCTFSWNLAKTNGAGMDNSESSPILKNCTFRGNLAEQQGGGMCNFYKSCPLLVNCIFSENSSDVGGAMHNYPRSDPTLTKCILSGNSASRYGGGIANELGSPTVNNCIFSGNSANIGGGVLNWLGSSTLNECTFALNSALNGSAIACDYVERTPQKYIKLTNCILWDGGNEIWNNSGSIIDITYSDVRGGQGSIYDPHECVIWGSSNIDADPLFANPGYWDPNGTSDDPNDDIWINGDYYLKSEAGRWDPVSGSWVKDEVTSPCIDAGDPNGCLGYHEPHPNGRVINMGAYGGTDQASMSLSTDECIFYWFERYEWENVGMPICWCYPRQCHGDADCKAQGKQEYWVSTNDLDVLIAAWNKPFEEIEGKEVHGVPLICADFAHLPQGKQRFRVSFMDLDILIANWNIANGPAADCP